MLCKVETDRFLQSFSRMREQMDDHAAQAWNRAGKQAKEAQHEHGYQNKTGRLTASMRWVSRGRRRFSYLGAITTRAKYAKWVDEGTGLYGPRKDYIRPKRAKFLRFYWDKVGSVVYARKVKGMRAAKFSDQARETFERVAPVLLQYGIDAAIRASNR